MKLPIPTFISSIPYDKLNSIRDKRARREKRSKSVSLQLQENKGRTMSLENIDWYPFSPLPDHRKLDYCIPQQFGGHISNSKDTIVSVRPSRSIVKNKMDSKSSHSADSKTQRWDHPDLHTRKIERRSRTVPPRQHLISHSTTVLLLMIWTIMCIVHGSCAFGFEVKRRYRREADPQFLHSRHLSPSSFPPDGLLFLPPPPPDIPAISRIGDVDDIITHPNIRDDSKRNIFNSRSSGAIEPHAIAPTHMGLPLHQRSAFTFDSETSGHHLFNSNNKNHDRRFDLSIERISNRNQFSRRIGNQANFFDSEKVNNRQDNFKRNPTDIENFNSDIPPENSARDRLKIKISESDNLKREHFRRQNVIPNGVRPSFAMVPPETVQQSTNSPLVDIRPISENIFQVEGGRLSLDRSNTENINGDVQRDRSQSDTPIDRADKNYYDDDDYYYIEGTTKTPASKDYMYDYYQYYDDFKTQMKNENKEVIESPPVQELVNLENIIDKENGGFLTPEHIVNSTNTQLDILPEVSLTEDDVPIYTDEFQNEDYPSIDIPEITTEMNDREKEILRTAIKLREKLKNPPKFGPGSFRDRISILLEKRQEAARHRSRRPTTESTLNEEKTKSEAGEQSIELQQGFISDSVHVRPNVTSSIRKSNFRTRFRNRNASVRRTRPDNPQSEQTVDNNPIENIPTSVKENLANIRKIRILNQRRNRPSFIKSAVSESANDEYKHFDEEITFNETDILESTPYLAVGNETASDEMVTEAFDLTTEEATTLIEDLIRNNESPVNILEILNHFPINDLESQTSTVRNSVVREVTNDNTLSPEKPEASHKPSVEVITGKSIVSSTNQGITTFDSSTSLPMSTVNFIDLPSRTSRPPTTFKISNPRKPIVDVDFEMSETIDTSDLENTDLSVTESIQTEIAADEFETTTFSLNSSPSTTLPSTTLPSTIVSAKSGLSSSASLTTVGVSSSTVLPTSALWNDISSTSINPSEASEINEEFIETTTVPSFLSRELIELENSINAVEEREGNNSSKVAVKVIKDILDEKPIIKITSDVPAMLTGMMEAMKNTSMKIKSTDGKTSFSKIEPGNENSTAVKTTITLFTDQIGERILPKDENMTSSTLIKIENTDKNTAETFSEGSNNKVESQTEDYSADVIEEIKPDTILNSNDGSPLITDMFESRFHSRIGDEQIGFPSENVESGSSFAHSTMLTVVTQPPLELTTTESSFVRLQQLLNQFEQHSRPELSAMTQFLGLGIESTASTNGVPKEHRRNQQLQHHENIWNNRLSNHLHNQYNHRDNSFHADITSPRTDYDYLDGEFESTSSTSHQALVSNDMNFADARRKTLFSSDLEDLSLAASEGRLNSETELQESTTILNPVTTSLDPLLNPVTDANEVTTISTRESTPITSTSPATTTIDKETKTSTTVESTESPVTLSTPEEITTVLTDAEVEFLEKSTITTDEIDQILNATANSTADEVLEILPEVVELTRGRLVSEVNNTDEATNTTLALKHFLLMRREKGLTEFSDQSSSDVEEDKMISSDAVRERLRLLRIFKAKKERQTGNSDITKHFTKVKGATKVYQRTDQVDLEDIGVRVSSAVKLSDILSRRHEEERQRQEKERAKQLEEERRAKMQTTTITPPPTLREQLMKLRAKNKAKEPKKPNLNNIVKVNGFRVITEDEEEDEIDVPTTTTVQYQPEDYITDDNIRKFLPTVPPGLSGFRDSGRSDELTVTGRTISDVNLSRGLSGRRSSHDPHANSKKMAAFGALEELLVRQTPRNDSASLASRLKNKIPAGFLPTVPPPTPDLLSFTKNQNKFLTEKLTVTPQPVKSFVTTLQPFVFTDIQKDITYTTPYSDDYQYYDYYDYATVRPVDTGFALKSRTNEKDELNRSKFLQPHKRIHENAFLDSLVEDQSESPLEQLHQKSKLENSKTSEPNGLIEETIIVGDSLKEEINAFIADSEIDSITEDYTSGITETFESNLKKDNSLFMPPTTPVIDENDSVRNGAFSNIQSATEDSTPFSVTISPTKHQLLSQGTFRNIHDPRGNINHIVHPPRGLETSIPRRDRPPSSVIRGAFSGLNKNEPSKISLVVTKIPSKHNEVTTQVNAFHDSHIHSFGRNHPTKPPPTPFFGFPNQKLENENSNTQSVEPTEQKLGHSQRQNNPHNVGSFINHNNFNDRRPPTQSTHFTHHANNRHPSSFNSNFGFQSQNFNFKRVPNFSNTVQNSDLHRNSHFEVKSAESPVLLQMFVPEEGHEARRNDNGISPFRNFVQNSHRTPSGVGRRQDQPGTMFDSTTASSQSINLRTSSLFNPTVEPDTRTGRNGQFQLTPASSQQDSLFGFDKISVRQHGRPLSAVSDPGILKVEHKSLKQHEQSRNNNVKSDNGRLQIAAVPNIKFQELQNQVNQAVNSQSINNFPRSNRPVDDISKINKLESTKPVPKNDFKPRESFSDRHEHSSHGVFSINVTPKPATIIATDHSIGNSQPNINLHHSRPSGTLKPLLIETIPLPNHDIGIFEGFSPLRSQNGNLQSIPSINDRTRSDPSAGLSNNQPRPSRPTLQPLNQLEAPQIKQAPAQTQQPQNTVRFGNFKARQELSTARPGILLPLAKNGSQPITRVTQLEEEGSIPGTAGVDYPAYRELPTHTNFNCDEYVPRGSSASGQGHLFPDVGTRCQVYHLCQEGARASFLCPVGTVFNQVTQVCQWWYQVKCKSPEALSSSFF